MRICIIAGNYYQSTDGIGRYFSNLLEELNSRYPNTYTEIVTGTKYKSKIQSNNSLIRVNKFTNLIASIFINSLKPLKIEIDYLARFKKDRFDNLRALKNTHAQVYHAISPSESIAPILLRKRPLVTTIHDLIPLVSEKRYLLEKVYFNYYLNFAKKSNLIIADSYHTKKELISILKIPSNMITIVYPGIDTEIFFPINSKKTNRIKNILYLGGLVKRKGVYELLYAFAQLLKIRNDVNLLIGGTGEETNKLKSEIKKLQITKNVRLLGFIDESKMLETYHMADLFVYPSKYEGFGYTPLEAMACGIPVICSNTSCMPEVVGEAAIKVNPYNPKEICFAINKVLDDKELQNSMIEKGLLRVQKFKKEIFAKKINDLYKSLL